MQSVFSVTGCRPLSWWSTSNKMEKKQTNNNPEPVKGSFQVQSNGFSVKSNKFLCAEGPAPWRQQKQDMSLQYLTQHTGCSLSAVIYCFYSSTSSKNKTNIKTCNFMSLFENAFHVLEWVKQVSQSSMRTLSSRQMSAAVHNGPSFTGVNGCFQYRVLIQVWELRVCSVCWSMVVVLYGRFCATVFSKCPFWFKEVTLQKSPLLCIQISYTLWAWLLTRDQNQNLTTWE